MTENETVELRTSDGVILRGRCRWPEAQQQVPGTVLVVHGFAGSQDDAAICCLADALRELGCIVLTYDARGHGGSGGQSAVGSAEHLDVASAVEYAVGLGRPVVIVGGSMGGVAVINYLAQLEDVPDQLVGAVVVSAPARWRMRPSIVGLFTAGLTRTRAGRWVADRYLKVRIASAWKPGPPPEDLVRQIQVPLTFIHGRRDRLLASDHGRRLHRSAQRPIELHEVAEMGHGFDEVGRRTTIAAVVAALHLEAAIEQ